MLHQRRVCVCVGVCTHTCTGILVFQMFPSVLRRGAGRAAPETSVRVCRCVHTYMHWNTRISDVPQRSSLKSGPCCIRRVRVCCVCVHRHVHKYSYFRCSPAFFAEERAVLHPTCACVCCVCVHRGVPCPCGFRCSPAFFAEERAVLHQRRDKMRTLQQRKGGDAPDLKDLPPEIPMPLVIGTKVTGEGGACACVCVCVCV